MAKVKVKPMNDEMERTEVEQQWLQLAEVDVDCTTMLSKRPPTSSTPRS